MVAAQALLDPIKRADHITVLDAVGQSRVFVRTDDIVRKGQDQGIGTARNGRAVQSLLRDVPADRHIPAERNGPAEVIRGIHCRQVGGGRRRIINGNRRVLIAGRALFSPIISPKDIKILRPIA